MLLQSSNTESIGSGRRLQIDLGSEPLGRKISHFRTAPRVQDPETERSRMYAVIFLLTRGADRLEAALAAIDREIEAIEDRLKKLSESRRGLASLIGCAAP